MRLTLPHQATQRSGLLTAPCMSQRAACTSDLGRTACLLRNHSCYSITRRWSRRGGCVDWGIRGPRSALHGAGSEARGPRSAYKEPRHKGRGSMGNVTRTAAEGQRPDRRGPHCTVCGPRRHSPGSMARPAATRSPDLAPWSLVSLRRYSGESGADDDDLYANNKPK